MYQLQTFQMFLYVLLWEKLVFFDVNFIYYYILLCIDAENDDDIKLVFAIDEGIEMLSATGFRKPLCSLQISDRPSILSALTSYHLMAKVKSEMDQFKEGLKVLGFLDMLHKNTDTWKPFFVHCQCTLSAGSY